MNSRLSLIAVLCLLLFACSSPFAFVDEDRRMVLQGVVTAAASGEQLEGVYVSLEWTPKTNPGSGVGPVQHVDASTAADGSYRVEVRLNEVNCSTLFLRVSTSGYRAVFIHPDCRSGKQTFNVALPSS